MDIENLVGTYWPKIIEATTTYGLKIFYALLVIWIGFKIVGFVGKIAQTALNNIDLEPSLRKYVAGILTTVLKILVLITAAGMLGIETTSFVAMIGAAGLAIGMALQGSLANFAGGFLILIFKPFKVGDYIKGQGHEGIVQEISVFVTTLLSLDNKTIIIPNGPLAGGDIINFTKQELRRADINVGISYDANIAAARTTLMTLAQNDPKVLNNPAPTIPVVNLGDSSVDLQMRFWCKTDDYWDVYLGNLENAKLALDQEKISIPFPQRDVHVYNHGTNIEASINQSTQSI